MTGPGALVGAVAMAPGLRVLVVDDDQDASDLLERMARRGGYTTFAVDNGVSAIAALSWYKPDVVLLDWLLPDISGAEVCRRTVDAANATGTGRPAFVLVSARTDDLDVEIAFAHGADAYLAKPLRRQQVLSAIDTARDVSSAPARPRTHRLQKS